MPSPLLDDFYTRTTLAAELQVCERTLIRWHARGEGPALTVIGRRPLYRRSTVESWLVAREGEAP